MSKTRLQLYEDRTQFALTLLALAFLAVYAAPVIDTNLPDSLVDACTFASWVIWAAFGLDYIWRLYISEKRIRFVRGHIVELISVALPLLRPLRALRVLSLANLAARFDEDDRIFVNAARALVGAIALLVTISSVAMLDVERDADGANITNFGDALWWGIVTITTVGYGDFFPVTFQGRMIAAAMMLLGIALIGVVTAGIASWAVTYLQRNRIREDVSGDD